MRNCITLMAAVCVLVPTRAFAQDSLAVEYICGKTGFKHKMKGHLVVTDSQVTFVSETGSPVFLISLQTLGDAFTNVDASAPGGRLEMHGFCNSSKDELLYLYSETAQSAEAVVFKPKAGTAQTTVANIRSRAVHKPVPAARPDSQKP